MKRVLVCVAAMLIVGCGAAPGGTTSTGSPSPSGRAVPAFAVTSADLASGVFPKQFTCDGGNHPPRVDWTDPPASSKGFVIEMLDPDAAGGVYVHWLVYNFPPAARALEGALPGPVIEGMASNGSKGYLGPCPPPGPAHHYHLDVLALDAPVFVAPDLDRANLERRISGHIAARGELVATYAR